MVKGSIQCSKELSTAIGEAVMNHYSIITRDGDYIQVSLPIQQMSGYAAHELQNIKQYLHEEDIPIAQAQLDAILPGETALVGPVRFRLKNGNVRWIESYLTNLSHQPEVSGYLMSSRDVTDRFEAAHIRNVVVTSYSNFFSKHPFGVLHLTKEGVVDMINPKLHEDLGYTLADIEKRPLISFFPPQYRRKVAECYFKAWKFGHAETFDVEVCKLNKHRLHANLTIIPVVHEGRTIELYAVIEDISDRHALQESLRRTSIVADKTTNGVIISDYKGVIEWVNNGFTQMSGYTLQEAVGKNPNQLLRTDVTAERRGLMMEQLAAGHAFVKEILCLKKDGTPYWNLVDVTPVMDSSNQLQRLISIHTDVSERKKAEQQLQQFARDLYERNRELQQFGYIVSHNLRSPVANILGIANIMDIDRDNPEIMNYCVDNLQVAAQSLDNIIKDLSVILSGLDGSAELSRENVNITELLSGIRNDLAESIRNTGAELILPDKTYELPSHKAYLYSIFYNLITNAIKYRLAARKPIIQIELLHRAHSLRIAVKDNGIGIDLQKHRKNMFKPYNRFNLNVEGKGLGLFLVKSHVEALTGKIAVKSKPGEGTTFVIVLPLKRQLAQSNEAVH